MTQQAKSHAERLRTIATELEDKEQPWDPDWEDPKPEDGDRIAAAVAGLMFLILLIVSFNLSTTVVKPGTVGIALGNYTGTPRILQPGRHLTLGHKVTIYNHTQNLLDFSFPVRFKAGQAGSIAGTFGYSIKDYNDINIVYSNQAEVDDNAQYWLRRGVLMGIAELSEPLDGDQIIRQSVIETWKDTPFELQNLTIKSLTIE